MVENGVDVVEVGLPYSDPLMDGPTIQAAVDVALAQGTTTDDVLRTVEGVAGTGAVPLVMSYWNPVERYGLPRFAEGLAAAGGVGVITPDLTPEEAGPWVEATDAAGLDRIFLAAPSSTDARLRVIADATTGFVYAASTMGVTGARTAVGPRAADLVARLRAVTTHPVAVGLGVSTGVQAAEVAGYADGVIVGSAFVAAAARRPDARRRCCRVRAAGRRAGRGCPPRPPGPSLTPGTAGVPGPSGPTSRFTGRRDDMRRWPRPVAGVAAVRARHRRICREPTR